MFTRTSFLYFTKIAALTGVFGFISYPLKAQIELIATGGSSHFLGDLGGKPTVGTNGIADLDVQSTRYMAGLGLRFNLGHRVALRGWGYYARLAADDRFTTNRERHMRNLNFFTPVLGAEAMLEIKLREGYNGSRWYAYAGAGYFKFNPQTKYMGEKVELQPLGTEGQYFLPGKSPYKLSSFTIPFGVGYKFPASKFGYLSVSVDSRKTFTDYIDDVSTQFVDKTALMASNGPVAVALSDRSNPDGRIIGFSEPGAIRGNPNNNDNFFFLSVSYNIFLTSPDHSASYRMNRGRGGKKFNDRCFSF